MIQIVQLHGTDKKLYELVAPLVMSPGVQAVDVEPCHHWFFGSVVCLFLDDGGKGADFRRGHSDGGGFV